MAEAAEQLIALHKHAGSGGNPLLAHAAAPDRGAEFIASLATLSGVTAKTAAPLAAAFTPAELARAEAADFAAILSTAAARKLAAALDEPLVFA